MSDFSPEGGSRLNRKQRRVLEREARKGVENKPSNPGRREFLKKLGIGLGILGVAGAGGLKLLDNEREKGKTFKERVLEFNWNNIHSQEELRPFLESGVREYLKVTNSPNLTGAQLLEPGRITFYRTTKEFEEAIRKTNPSYNGKDAAVTTPYKREMILNLQKMQEDCRAYSPGHDGVYFARLLFHELGHMDYKEREATEFADNPDYFFVHPNTKQKEPYKRYWGGVVIAGDSLNNFGFTQSQEVILDSLASRMLTERLDIPMDKVAVVDVDSIYYKNGLDSFLPFSRKFMSLNELYRLYSTSDFEGLTKAIGVYLPGDESATKKGWNYLVGIHERNPQRIAATGVHRILR